jgi:hypothetical protein
LYSANAAAAGPDVCSHQLHNTQEIINTIIGPPLIVSQIHQGGHLWADALQQQLSCRGVVATAAGRGRHPFPSPQVMTPPRRAVHLSQQQLRILQRAAAWLIISQVSSAGQSHIQQLHQC